jgi:hypothetical protein
MVLTANRTEWGYSGNFESFTGLKRIGSGADRLSDSESTSLRE